MDTKNKTGFAVFRMPGDADYYSLTGPVLTHKNSSYPCFYFSQFDSGMINAIQGEKFEKNNWPSIMPVYHSLPSEIAKSDYIEAVEQITQKINAGEFTKVVFSRTILEDKRSDFDLKETFFTLSKTYPNAFIYCLSSEETGTWMGATPELLLNKENKAFSTVSLAGTRTKQVDWTEKERNEQRVVTDYLTSKISPLANNLIVSEPFDLKAGEIIHLKSTIEFELNQPENIWQLIHAFHPTPAICGIPVNPAKRLIRQLENRKRELYTGFIGPASSNNDWKLFVNLRCMQVGTRQFALYVGGGIMGNSVAESEWNETENKAKTLKKVL